MPTPVQQYQPLSVGQVSPLAYSVSQLPSMMQSAQEQARKQQEAQLMNQIRQQQIQQNQIQMKYLEPELQAELKKSQQQADLPLGGMELPGVAGQAMGVEYIGKAFGYNSPQYKRALDAFNLDQQSQQQTMAYQQALTQSMPFRSLSPLGKSYVEQSNVQQGLSPAGQSWPKLLSIASQKGNENSPYSPEEMSNAYELARTKLTTDPQARQRNLYATNIEKTLDMIDPDSLTQYGGIKQAQLMGQYGLSPFGAESKNFDKYKKSLQAVDMLTTQVRQFYGDSIQPDMIDRLNRLSNTASWSNNPKLAKQLFDETKNILQAEMGTYRDVFKSTDVYKGQNTKGNSKKLKYDPSTGEFK